MVADFVFLKDTWIFIVPCLVKPMFSNNFKRRLTGIIVFQIDFQRQSCENRDIAIKYIAAFTFFGC